MRTIQNAIAALPPPVCRQEKCAQKFERVAAECRPGELDIAVRCRQCQAAAHYTLDAVTGVVYTTEGLAQGRATSRDASSGEPAPDGSQQTQHADAESERQPQDGGSHEQVTTVAHGE